LRGSSSYNDRQSLFLKANNVFFNGEVGSVPAVDINNEFIYTSVRNNTNNFYLLRVNAQYTYINADISTNGGQQYNGLNETDSISQRTAKVVVGGDKETVTLLSVDPFININGLIDDKTKGFHILVTKAVSLVYDQAPIIYASLGVGTITPFKNWLPSSAYQVPDPTLITSAAPSIGSGGNVRTMSASLSANVKFANGSNFAKYIDPSTLTSDSLGRILSNVNNAFIKSMEALFSSSSTGTVTISNIKVNQPVTISTVNNTSAAAKASEVITNNKAAIPEVSAEVKETKIEQDISNDKAVEKPTTTDKRTQTNKNCADKKSVNCKN
jgi:hypothetical protein